MDKLNIIVSPQLCNIPFMENVDGTREQMAASQMKQSLLLKNGDIPYVITGLESHQEIFTTNVIVADMDGIIEYVDEDFTILNSNGSKIVYTFEPNVKSLVTQGQKVKAGQILARKSNFILYGKNLLTAVCSYHGFNYEDAIPISESASKKLTHYKYTDVLFTLGKNHELFSLEENNYKPLLSRNELVKKGQVIIRGKDIDFNNVGSFKKVPFEKTSQVDGKVIGVALYVNKNGSWINEYGNFITSYLSKVKQMKDELRSKFGEGMPSRYMDMLFKHKNLFERDTYKMQNEEIQMAIKYKIESEHRLQPGDKLSNRYGNKGVCSIIFPDDRMLKLFNKPVDIIINQSGFIKRMNLVGQLKELKASIIAKLVRDKAIRTTSKAEIKELKVLAKYIVGKIHAVNSKWVAHQFFHLLKTRSDEEILHELKTFSLIQPPFESCRLSELNKLSRELKIPAEFKSLDYHTGKYIKFNGGYMFWQSLHHLAEEKLSVRSIGPYSTVFLQPVSGKKNRGGQKFGEMELWALSCHNALENLKEIIYFKSDDFNSKVEVMNNIIMNNAQMPKQLSSSVSKDFKTFLQCIGLDIQDIGKKIKEDKNQK